jgi:hypothetical protein
LAAADRAVVAEVSAAAQVVEEAGDSADNQAKKSISASKEALFVCTVSYTRNMKRLGTALALGATLAMGGCERAPNKGGTVKVLQEQTREKTKGNMDEHEDRVEMVSVIVETQAFMKKFQAGMPVQERMTTAKTLEARLKKILDARPHFRNDIRYCHDIPPMEFLFQKMQQEDPQIIRVGD